jgi:hypothetical protein
MGIGGSSTRSGRVGVGRRSRWLTVGGPAAEFGQLAQGRIGGQGRWGSNTQGIGPRLARRHGFSSKATGGHGRFFHVGGTA